MSPGPAYGEVASPKKGPPITVILSDRTLRALLSGQPAVATGRMGPQIHDVHFALTGVTKQTLAIIVDDILRGRPRRNDARRGPATLDPDDPGQAL